MISIRRAKLQDLQSIADFQLKLADETEGVTLDKNIVSKGVKALFDDPGKGVYYVADVDGETAGCFLITYEWSDWRNGVVWWLQSVYVAARFRKQGVFRKMHDHLLASIRRDPGVLGLRLYVDKTNIGAQRVYTSLAMNGDHYTVFEWMKN